VPQQKKIKMANYTELEEVLLEDTITVEEKKLVIFNDDVNTFDFVINSLIDVCKHEVMQAEQCTLIIHYNGKCAVKNGEYDKLEPMCTALLDRGLTAEIQ
jgi:ATP-dependent Clp protease adaptor protein ClpS